MMLESPRLASLALVLLLAGVTDVRAQGVPPPPPPPPPPSGRGSPSTAPMTAGTGTISGIVIDGATKAPLAGATVYLGPPYHGPPGQPVRQFTDARGRFAFHNLPAYTGYSVSVNKFGYFEGAFGPGSVYATQVRIPLADGQTINDISVTLWRPGAITGRVVDQLGEPVVGIPVRVLPSVVIAGHRQLTAGPAVMTDDRGVYRISDLMPGRYLVEVPSIQSSVPASALAAAADARAAAPAGSPARRDGLIDRGNGHQLQVGMFVTPLPLENGRAMAYPPTFYPGAPSIAEAQAIDLAYSQERAGVDIRLQPVAAFVVSGRIDGPPESWTNLTVRLKVPGLEELAGGSEAAAALVAADGTFTFLDVPAGSYMLDARRTVLQYETTFNLFGQSAMLPTPPAIVPDQVVFAGNLNLLGAAPPSVRLRGTAPSAGDSYWGRQAVDVNGRDVHGVVVAMQRMGRMTGRFVWEDSPAPPLGTLSRVRMDAADGRPSLGLPRTTIDGTSFTIDGLMAGDYFLSITGATVKSILWNGRDYTTRPFDAAAGQDFADVIVTLTTKSTLVTGAVRDERGGTVDDSAVFAFPTDKTLWRDFGLSPARLKSTAVSSASDYRLSNLPPGEYYLVAVPGDLAQAWSDPDALDAASRVATRVTLTLGDQKNVDLRIVRIR
jgi:Carboxypeptidase regulatory-like domain